MKNKVIYYQKSLLKNKRVLNKIKTGSIFIYPTDTIYGIGCSALNKKSIEKIREIKGRNKKPFSIIVPNKKWIKDHCKVQNKWLKKLPGKFTLIIKLKTKDLPKNISFGDTLGVRIPKHWISKLVKKLKIPIITTSVNKADKKYMTNLKDLDKGIAKKAEFILFGGPLNKRPSTIIDTIHNKIIKRCQK